MANDHLSSGGTVTDSYQILTIEDDRDPTTYLRLALLRTRHTEHPVRCPTSVRALLQGVTRTNRAGTNDSACTTPNHAPPITFILEETPDRLDALTAYFSDAGCAVIPLTDVDQALSMSSVISPDLMVLPEPAPGIRGAALHRLRSQHPSCPAVVTTVLDPGAQPCPAPIITTATSTALAR